MQWSEGSFFLFCFVLFCGFLKKQYWTKTFCSQSKTLSVKGEEVFCSQTQTHVHFVAYFLVAHLLAARQGYCCV